MLVRFTDDYIDEISEGLALLGQIQSYLCCVEPFVGSSKVLDGLYAHSVVIAGIVDHLMHDDNSNPEDNEALLLCLRTVLDLKLCGPQRPPVLDLTNYHITQPISTVNPPAGPAFDQGINQNNPILNP